MHIGSMILLMSSAFLYALPFVWTPVAWWLIFCAPIPFLAVVWRESISVFALFAWNMLILIMHAWGIFYALMSMAHGSVLLKGALLVLIVIVHTAVQTVVLYPFAYVVRRMPLAPYSNARLVWWSVGYWCWIQWATCYAFWPYDHCCGYFLMHPLIPLAHNPHLLALLPILGPKVMTLIMLLFALACTYALQRRTMKSWGIVCISMLFWTVGFFIPIKQIHPEWISQIVALPLCVPYNPCSTAMALPVYRNIKHIMQVYPMAKLIIMPESSFYSTQLMYSPEVTALWSECMHAKVSLIMGAFRTEHGRVYNSLYWFYYGTLHRYFDKRHALPLTERIPLLCNNDLIVKTYFHTFPPIACADNARPLLEIVPDVVCVPYICSELFLCELPDDAYTHTPILALCNDRWFQAGDYTYIPRLMYLTAHLKAIQWQRDIIYVSYDYACFISRAGGSHPLKGVLPV
jgi:hypothetical protein